MTQHTKGPWEWFMKGSNYFTLQSVDDDVLYPASEGGNYGLSLREHIIVNEADARLISAAPELLEALQAALDSANELLLSSADFPRQTIEAVLAKAVQS